jgi:hypothetical protein
MNTHYKAAWWLPGPHLQTLWNPLCRKPPQLQRRRERLWLQDGDFLDLDWHGPHAAEAPLVLVLDPELDLMTAALPYFLAHPIAPDGQAGGGDGGAAGEPAGAEGATAGPSSDEDVGENVG